MKEYSKEQLLWMFNQGIFIGYHEGKPDTVQGIIDKFEEILKTIIQ